MAVGFASRRAEIKRRSTNGYRYAGCSHMGLIGFDGEAGSRYVRPELLRLAKQGTKINANDNLALAA